MQRGLRALKWVLATLALCTPAWAAGVAGAAVSPAVGRWAGSGQGGTVYFVVSRVRGTDVFSDLVEQCDNGTPSGGDIPWSRNKEGPRFRNEAAIGADGRIYDLFRVPHARGGGLDEDAHGKLSGRHGTLTIRGNGEGETGDGDESCAIRHAHVSWIGGPTLPDGDYKVSGGAPGTDAELSVFGEGAEVWWDGLFGTPVGGIEDDPALCAEVEAVASGIGDVFFGKHGRTFSSHSVSAFDAVLFTGHFSGRTHGFGGYVATSYPVCAGTGALTWSLARRAPRLVPAVPLHENPPPPPQRRPAPNHNTGCAMRFQVQQGKATPHSRPVHAPHAITVKKAVAGLDALQTGVASGLRKASHQAFTDTQKWVVARPRHGGVSAIGNVKRVFFKYQKKNWRLDTENLRCHNLKS